MPRTRKIIVYIATSADGFIARPDGSVDWLDRPRPKGGYGMGAFYKTIDTILWGRKTYEVALDFQNKGVPGSAFDPRIKNYVFTRTLPASEAAPGVEFVNEPAKDFASRLRAEQGRPKQGQPKKSRPKQGKDIWIMGGAGLIASFLDAGEIDEFDVRVVPVFIGEGIPLIAPRHRTVPLTLISSTKFADGVVRLRYGVR